MTQTSLPIPTSCVWVNSTSFATALQFAAGAAIARMMAAGIAGNIRSAERGRTID
jgi:hypothetical protein